MHKPFTIDSVKLGWLSCAILYLLLIPHAQAFNSQQQPCPDSFNEVSVIKGGKLCQIFAADYPASLIYFLPMSVSQTLANYKQTALEFETQYTAQNRILLKTLDNNTTLILSPDGRGTQVDILVKRQP